MIKNYKEIHCIECKSLIGYSNVSFNYHKSSDTKCVKCYISSVRGLANI